MWQQVAVYIIGVAVAVYIAVRVYRFFARRNDPCFGCDGCTLRSELDKKRKEYQANIKNGRKPRPDGGCGCGCK